MHRRTWHGGLWYLSLSLEWTYDIFELKHHKTQRPMNTFFSPKSRPWPHILGQHIERTISFTYCLLCSLPFSANQGVDVGTKPLGKVVLETKLNSVCQQREPVSNPDKASYWQNKSSIIDRRHPQGTVPGMLHLANLEQVLGRWNMLGNTQLGLYHVRKRWLRR